MDDQNLVPCKYCGKPIPSETNFCWYRTRELIARPERPDVPQGRAASGAGWFWLAAILIGGFILALALY